MLGYTNAKVGRREESLQKLDKFLALKNTQKGKAFGIALVHVGLCNIDEAFEWLEKAVENREFTIMLLDVMILLGDLHQDPRFAALRKKLGLSR